LRWFLRLRRGTIRVPSLLVFLRALKRHRRRPVLLVWDRLPGHRSRAVRTFLIDNRSWLTVEWLPPYSPQLNPIELLWGHLDNNTLANTPAENLTLLGRRTRRGVSRVQATPSIGRGFLAHTGLFTY
jgi:transposase